MNELAAIRLLRFLITHEGGVLASGRYDPGWCCNEHALIASLAFALAGKKTFVCDGKLLIITKNCSDIMEVFPHKFLIDDSSDVFDSSLKYETLEGVPICRKQRPSDTIVMVRSSESPAAALVQKLGASKFNRCLYYTTERPLLLQPTILQLVSDTPFGVWLNHHLGNQAGLWSKAAWHIREALGGRSPILGVSMESMWDSIARSPDRDNEVKSALAAVQQP